MHTLTNATCSCAETSLNTEEVLQSLDELFQEHFDATSLRRPSQQQTGRIGKGCAVGDCFPLLSYDRPTRSLVRALDRMVADFMSLNMKLFPQSIQLLRLVGGPGTGKVGGIHSCVWVLLFHLAHLHQSLPV